jgi:methyl-accepting chemotaxis protein/methyl-accepting chemotaxis protein-1 (serine sensor receptor)
MTIGKKILFAFGGACVLLLLVGTVGVFTSGTIEACVTALGIVIAAALGVLVVRSITGSMHELVQEIANGAEQVSSAATQIAGASQSLADGTSQQAASLEETSASTEEINSMARRNSENSHSAADLVKQSDQRFSDTNRSLQEMVLAMGEINASSDKISKIIKVIDEIAFQTNILALNAAVEAARAGEAGMGFAVVADEVRNLAQRCAQAARDTAVLIEESINKSNDGKTKVDQVAKAIHTITEQSTQVKTLVDEVHLGSQEQSRGIEQIGRAIVQMEQVTQKAAASAEESASAAEELTAQSTALKDIVGRLNSMVGNAGSTRSSAHVYSRSPRRPIPAKSNAKANMTTSLSALRTAVAQKPSRKQAPVAVPAGHDRDAFPMDEDFKEF